MNAALVLPGDFLNWLFVAGGVVFLLAAIARLKPERRLTLGRRTVRIRTGGMAPLVVLLLAFAVLAAFVALLFAAETDQAAPATEPPPARSDARQ